MLRGGYAAPQQKLHPTNAMKHQRLYNAIPLIAVLLLVIYACRDLLPWPGEADPLKRGIVPVALPGGAAQIFFTTPALRYPDVARWREPPPIERALLRDIAAAQQSIDLAVFEYNLDSIAEALVTAQRRGVRVRLVLDRECLHKPAMAHWAGIVEAAGIPISWEQSSDFMHSKLVVIDERLVWMGSANLTVNDIYRNNNNMLRIAVSAIAASYSAEFAQLFAGDFDDGIKAGALYPELAESGLVLESYFSPQDKPRARVVELIAGAQQSIDFMAFSFTDDSTGAAMLERQQAGIALRGIIERRNANGLGSEYGILSAAEPAVLKDGNCYTFHHKIIVIDRRIVITGSYNFTARAEDVNSETMLILDSPAVAAAYLAEFERVYAQAQQPTRCSR